MPAPPQTIAALHAQWREGNGTPLSHMASCLELAASHNSQRHVYIQLLNDRAIAQAQQASQLAISGNGWPALLGVPVAVKDNIDVAGIVTSVGSRLLARHGIEHSSAVVVALESAGAIVVGKSNMDEAALGASGRNAFFGRCVNPRWPTRLSGGSSSGSAAAVAEGSCLLGIGTDTLGSVRIPAALCGVSGFKPTNGLLALAGVEPLHPALDTLGLIANSLDDITLAFEVLTGAAAGSKRLPLPARVGFLEATALTAVDADVVAAYQAAISRLRQGAAIELVPFPAMDFGSAARAAFRDTVRLLADRLPADMASGTHQPGAELRELLLWARALPAARLESGRQQLRDAGLRFTQALAGCDVLLTPTCPVAGIDAAAPVPTHIAEFAALANISGSPAVCWPAVHEGSVFSLQLLAAPGNDLMLLDMARRLQALSGEA